MLHAYLDESGIHDSSKAVAVIAAVATPQIWQAFDSKWTSFLTELGLSRWHHRDFDKVRNDYRILSSDKLNWARERLCQIISDAAPFIVGAAIGRRLYEQVREQGKWRLPHDPYNFCLERCLNQAIKRVFSSRRDEGIVLFYDNKKRFGGISRELTRWHRDTFEASYLSEFKQRAIDLQFLEVPDVPARSVPDIIAFEACAYIEADTGIPFLGAKLVEGETPEPRPIIKRLMDLQRAILAVITYTASHLDLDLDHAGVVIRNNPPTLLAPKFWR